MNSPFSDRGMIEDPSRFFGRTVEKTQIFNALNSSKPQCVAIIGEKRIGRSSLLKNIQQVYPSNLNDSQHYVFGYLNLARDTCLTPKEFYATAAKVLFGVHKNTLSPSKFDELRDANNPTRTLKYVLLLDEFPTLLRRKRYFNNDFYDALRARADAGEITYVLASHVPLEEIAIEHKFGSTFFGIFTHVGLGEFTYEEARSSVMRPASPQLTGNDFNLVAKITQHQYHPLKLNIVADAIWNLRQQGKPVPEKEILESEYQKQIDNIFGRAIKKRRQQIERDEKLHKLWQNIKTSLEWWFEDNRYWFLVAVFFIILVAFRVINFHQFVQWLGLPVPTATPVPTIMPTPTP